MTHTYLLAHKHTSKALLDDRDEGCGTRDAFYHKADEELWCLVVEGELRLGVTTKKKKVSVAAVSNTRNTEPKSPGSGSFSRNRAGQQMKRRRDPC